MEKEKKHSTEHASGQPVHEVSQKNKKIGLFLLIGPIVGLIALIIINGIVSFFVGSTGADPESLSITVNIVRVILAFLGLICVIGILVGIPVGIIYLNKKEIAKDIKYDERSGKKEASIVPEEIKGWNWGAAGLTWIWGLYHGVWISLLIFIPLVNLVMWVILGIKGNEWAWKARPWESKEKFITSQKKWKPWGIAFFIISFLLGILSIFTK